MDANLGDEVRGSDECGDNVDNSEMEVGNTRIEGKTDEGRENFLYNPQVADHLKPSVGKEFKTIDEVKDFYNAYAKEAGFSIRSWATKKFEGIDEVKKFVRDQWNQQTSNHDEQLLEKGFLKNKP